MVLRQKLMEGRSQQAAAAATGMSVRTARTWQRGRLPSEKKGKRRWRTRSDPFAEVWAEEVELLLRSDVEGALKAATILVWRARPFLQRLIVWGWTPRRRFSSAHDRPDASLNLSRHSGSRRERCRFFCCSTCAVAASSRSFRRTHQDSLRWERPSCPESADRTAWDPRDPICPPVLM